MIRMCAVMKGSRVGEMGRQAGFNPAWDGYEHCPYPATVIVKEKDFAQDRDLCRVHAQEWLKSNENLTIVREIEFCINEEALPS